MSYAGPVKATGPKAATPMASAARARAGPARPFGLPVQAKLSLGPASGRFEREADRAAAHVVGGAAGAPNLSPLPLSGLAQRACAVCGGRKDDEPGSTIQRKCACGAKAGEPCTCTQSHEEEEHPELQIDRKARPGRTASVAPVSRVEDVVSSPGRPLPQGVRREMEQGFGRDFGQVRIHDNARAAASADGIGARAYTVGNHIAFAPGQYRPETRSGRLLLAHELAHTVQQARGPAPDGPRISQPGDRHEAQADRAAQAATSGAPMPVLSPGAAPISRYSWREFGEDIVGAGEAVVEAGSDVVEGAADIAGELWDTAVAIGEALGASVRMDGTTIVIDVPQFDPCPEIDFELSLSDLGLSPRLWFPLGPIGSPLPIGPILLGGAFGVEAQLDQGIGLRLQDCSFGPAQIRIDPVSANASIAGMADWTVVSMSRWGADLGLWASVSATAIIPAEPPIPLVIPLIGLSLGGAMELMMQSSNTVSSRIVASVGLGGLAFRQHATNTFGFSVDLAYGLYGSLSILRIPVCRVGWPLDQHHAGFSARITLASALSLDRNGLNFDYDFSAEPVAQNPLDDLGFAFGTERLEDDCPLCDFLINNNLMPSQNGYNWANHDRRLPRLPGPLTGIYRRDPGLASGALCRGTCGIDCPEGTCRDLPDPVECVERGDRHEWHTYVNYAHCGTHQGCRDHDACYDYAAEMPIWGFGGFMIGPMYRACDLDAMCGASFQQAVTWARGGGPYDGVLPYADRVDVTPGCYGPCPANAAPEGEAERMQTCIPDREIWPGVTVGDEWRVDFGDYPIFQSFAPIPYIGGVWYGANVTAGAAAAVGGTLGRISLENACLIYDPATQDYTGTAEIAFTAEGNASLTLAAGLRVWVADPACLMEVMRLSGDITGVLHAQLTGTPRLGVDLYCQRGDLQIRPRIGAEVCATLTGRLYAGLGLDVVGFNVLRHEWELLEGEIGRCWSMEYYLDPFSLGEAPSLGVATAGLETLDLLLDLFAPEQIDDRRFTPPRSILPERGPLLPCYSGGDEEDAPADCPDRATSDHGDRLTTPADRQPRYGGTRSVSVPGGSSANVATWMEAEYLTASHPPGAETNDRVQRGIYKKVGLPTSGCVSRGYKQAQVYVKGHLLNAGLGGPAEERNLFPITGQANADHKNRVEQSGLRVVKRVNNDRDLMYYKVTVRNPSAPQPILDSAGDETGFFEISATFQCEVADYQYCDNDTLRRNPAQSVDIRSEFVFHPSGGRPFDTIMRDCSR